MKRYLPKAGDTVRVIESATGIVPVGSVFTLKRDAVEVTWDCRWVRLFVDQPGELEKGSGSVRVERIAGAS